MKKNNKGFTLIELLAIIVILAIIAVITVPIILNIIENSRKGAATDSVFGFKDSINKYYLGKLSENQNYNDLDGEYTIDNNGYLVENGTVKHQIQTSGQKPTGGTLTIENKIITTACVQMGEYKVSITNGTVGQAEKGTCASNPDGSESESGQSNVVNYTYYVSGSISENPSVDYSYDYEDYQEPSGNNECPSGYAYDEGDNICYYVNVYYNCDDDFEYNYETGKCEGIGTAEIQDISDNNFYIRDDGTTPEVCGVFGSGQSETVCMTSSYYNSNYSSAGSYMSDFEDVTDADNITTTAGLAATGLKGYSLSKATEMLSKGASSCAIYYSFASCFTPNFNCYIDSDGNAVCNPIDSGTGCFVNYDGGYYCN